MWRYKFIPSCRSAYVGMKLHSRLTNHVSSITNISYDTPRFKGCGYRPQIWIEDDCDDDITAPVHYEEFNCKECPYWLYDKEWI